MLERCTTAQERWGGVHQMIDRWLHERHALIQCFENLRQPAEASTQNAANQALTAFCELLVDYVSAGHFEIYEQLLAEAREFNDERALNLAKQIYPRLEAITEAALNFNDRCEGGRYEHGVPLSTALKNLEKLLHERFELEDCLIEVLHTAHAQQANQG